jgi:hypothetical protein
VQETVLEAEVSPADEPRARTKREMIRRFTGHAHAESGALSQRTNVG